VLDKVSSLAREDLACERVEDELEGVLTVRKETAGFDHLQNWEKKIARGCGCEGRKDVVMGKGIGNGLGGQDCRTRSRINAIFRGGLTTCVTYFDENPGNERRKGTTRDSGSRCGGTGRESNARGGRKMLDGMRRENRCRTERMKEGRRRKDAAKAYQKGGLKIRVRAGEEQKGLGEVANCTNRQVLFAARGRMREENEAMVGVAVHKG